MKRRPRLIVFETCGRPEALLMRFLRLFGTSVSAVHFVEGVKPPPVLGLPITPQSVDLQGRCLQDLIDEGFEAIEKVFRGSCKEPHDFFRKLSSAICNDDELQEELHIALKANLKRHAYPTAVIRSLLAEDDPRIVLVTRTRIRKRILNELTPIRTLCIPFSDWPLKIFRSLRFGSHNPGASISVSETRVFPGADSSKVLFFPHKGLKYGNLYPWEQYFSEDRASPCHPANLLTLDYQLNAGSLHRPLPFLREMIKLAPASVQLIRLTFSVSSCQRIRFLFYALRLAAETRILMRRLVVGFPQATTALLSYEMLTPTSISLALKAAGIKRIANLERGTAYLTGLPILVDVLLVPNGDLEVRMRQYSMCSASTFVQVGHWRTDYLFKETISPAKCDVLVLPYHVDGNCDRNWAGLATSCANFRQHMETVLKLCRSHPDLSFIVRTKDARWKELEGLQDLIRGFEEVPNLAIADDYSQKAITYALARSSRLVIGRFSSVIEELYDYGTSTLVDNRAGIIDTEFRPRHLTLPKDSVCNYEDELLSRAATILADEPNSLARRHALCDGAVRQRIVAKIERELILKSSR